MRWTEIVGEAAPTDDMRGRRYYHGTARSDAAESIMRTGIQPGAIQQGRGRLDPVAGKVYVTPSIEYACIYALGGVGMGVKMSDGWINKNGPYGYVFVIDGNDLGDVQPDEDSIGDWLMKNTVDGWDNSTKPWRRLPRVFKPSGEEDDRKREVWHNIRYSFTDKQFADAVEGLIAAQAAGGKRALKRLSDRDKLDLIRWGAHIAHHGPIKPIECWRIDKRRSQEIARDASNFFEIAEKVPLTAEVTEARKKRRNKSWDEMKNAPPGSEEWFRAWFSLPYLTNGPTR